MKSTISAGKLLAIYYNINEGYINNLTHKELLVMFPMLDIASEDLITSDNLKTGNVLLVRDVDKDVLCYKNPYVYDKDNCCTKSNTITNVKINFDRFYGIDDSIVYSLMDTLKDYELEAYMKSSKKQKKYHLSKVLINELKNRKVDSKVRSRKLDRVLKRDKWEEEI